MVWWELSRELDAMTCVCCLHPGNEVPSQGSEVHQRSGGSTHAWKGPGGQSGGWVQGEFHLLMLLPSSLTFVLQYVWFPGGKNTFLHSVPKTGWLYLLENKHFEKHPSVSTWESSLCTNSVGVGLALGINVFAFVVPKTAIISQAWSELHFSTFCLWLALMLCELSYNHQRWRRVSRCASSQPWRWRPWSTPRWPGSLRRFMSRPTPPWREMTWSWRSRSRGREEGGGQSNGDVVRSGWKGGNGKKQGDQGIFTDKSHEP